MHVRMCMKAYMFISMKKGYIGVLFSPSFERVGERND